LGLVVVDKEPGWTSHDVVARCRRIFGQRRVGHAGTLDPDATGLLLVGLGRATRLLRFLSVLPKTYTTEIVLGTTTGTLDASGEVTGHWDMGSVTVDDARKAAETLTGRIQQIPPMVSAVKVGGQRLHRLARQGIEVERTPRTVEVHRFEVTEGPEPGVLRAEIDCSSGTYVRVLAADLGSALGGGAHLRNLRRTAVGDFTEADAHLLDALDSGAVIGAADTLRHLARVVINEEVATLIGRGLPLDRVSLGAVGPGPWAMLDESGALLAVYEATETDRILPAVVLAAH
jgi:tRNA pseudouridine55 synthase